MKLNNPFLIAGYHSREYFCDRLKETETITNALQNERNITLIAPRRMGKTGLIKNVFYHLGKKNETVLVYMDIFSTQNLNEFVHLFAASVLGVLDSDVQKLIGKVSQFLKNCRPVLTFDEITGQPQVSIDISPGKEEATLREIFDYITANDKRCVIAIDEFQQIAEYPEKGVEALLRSYIQFVPNTRFIFAGSKQHIMQEMFLSAKRPFYQSTQIVTIDAIRKEEYYDFTRHFFQETNRQFGRDTFYYMYDEFEGHTWYMQALLNRLYGYGTDVTDKTLINRAIQELTDEGVYGYQNLIAAYPGVAAKLMKAIAKEGIVTEINSGKFISKYKLKAASSINTALAKLIDKEIVYKDTQGYIIYDRFMSIWLRRQP